MAKKSPIVGFDYSDIMLLPGECKVRSRSETDVSTEFGGRVFRLPVVPANMSSVIGPRLAKTLASRGYFYIMHRFGIDPIEFTKEMHSQDLYSSVSFGVQKIDFEMVNRLSELQKPVEYITIDIAHGDTQVVFDLIGKIKKASPSTFVIAGNVATAGAVRRLEEAGADAVKCGISPGSVCLSGPNTGFGSRGWQLAAVEACAEAAVNTKIIADGGIRFDGDIAKAIAFGADMVMVGGMFAGHEESPGVTEIVNGEPHKVFYGSASARQKGDNKHVEGKSVMIPLRGSVMDTLERLEDNLRSSVSYSGGTKLADLYNVEYVLLDK